MDVGMTASPPMGTGIKSPTLWSRAVVARQPHKLKAVGSNPTSATKPINTKSVWTRLLNSHLPTTT